MIGLQQAVKKMNHLGKQGIPFLFVIDFLGLHPIVLPISEIKPEILLFDINGVTNFQQSRKTLTDLIQFDIEPLDVQRYKNAFEVVMQHLQRGDSYLLNLTMPVKLTMNIDLLQVFQHSKAKYKLLVNNLFTVFSPEPFIKIKDGIISTHPMKGTIDARLQNAAALLMADKKELAEHYTIVDLLRNDLSMVAENVRVDQFRYIEEIQTVQGKLLQTSSQISGQLPDGYESFIGDLLAKILPAGSVTGAPKKKTLEIIQAAEKYERGFYTGVFGYSDGRNLDSGVMIRYIEKTSKGMVFKAGGGITVNSNVSDEYNELMQKVYLPI